MKQIEFNFGNTNDSEFRTWITEQWFEYKDEVLAWEHRAVTGTPQDYYHKYKWFLKAKYKAERR